MDKRVEHKNIQHHAEYFYLLHVFPFLQAEWKKVWILIRLLCPKPSDLDLYYLQKWIGPGLFHLQGLKYFILCMCICYLHWLAHLSNWLKVSFYDDYSPFYVLCDQSVIAFKKHLNLWVKCHQTSQEGF